MMSQAFRTFWRSLASTSVRMMSTLMTPSSIMLQQQQQQLHSHHQQHLQQQRQHPQQGNPQPYLQSLTPPQPPQLLLQLRGELMDHRLYSQMLPLTTETKTWPPE